MMNRNHEADTRPALSVVIIGRNEGPRLVKCIASVQHATADLHAEIIYVDSASSDGSRERAMRMGARVLALDEGRLSAARGRNTGWVAARAELILFLDGDTELEPGFALAAMQAMAANPLCAAVWGHRRESRPQDSIYNRVLDLDWIYPPGKSQFCGGDALFRRSALSAAKGFDASLIAGEEPELCRRLRALGYFIEHIDEPMTRHDLGIQRFAQYWRRAERAGHAYASLCQRFSHTADPLWRSESRRNLIHAAALTCLPGVLVLLASQGALAAGLAGAAAIVGRTAWRARWKGASRATLLLYALHSHLQQLPIAVGQLRRRQSERRGEQRTLIEYKGV